MSLVDPSEPLDRQNAKLLRITEALMKRVEYQTAQSGAAYAQFERAALLEKRVKSRTHDLERTLDLLQDSNDQLAQAQAATEAARRDLAEAIETVRDGFALFDPDDRLVMFNSRFCRAFGSVAGWLAPGLAFRDYIAAIARAPELSLPEGDRPQDWEARRLERHADTDVMFTVALSGDRHLQVSERHTGRGGTVVLQTDVTDIVRSELRARADLRDQQARLIRATLDHLDQGVAIFDDAGRLLGWNTLVGQLLDVPAAEVRLGVTVERMIDRLDGEVTFADGASRSGFRHWAAARGRAGPIRFEVRRGARRVLQVFGQGMPDGGFVVSVTDVTAERTAAERLARMNEDLEARVLARTLDLEDALTAAERANRTKSRFVAAASHDLLQPISAAKLFLSSLDERARNSGDAEVLGKALRALSSAEGLIDALLDISKLDAAEMRFDVRPVALSEVLGPLCEEMEALAAEKGLAFRFVPASGMVETDPAYLRRIVQNLISNAIRYTASGRVLVGVRHAGNALRIEVHDTGPGIAEADQERIFEEFRRLDAAASRNEGLGLGLAIVERACARLGHPLGLWSEPGRGSVFTVTLPRARAADAALAGALVLVALAESGRVRVIETLLGACGAEVIAAEGAEEAMALLADLDIAPDAVVTGADAAGRGLVTELRDRNGALPACLLAGPSDTADGHSDPPVLSYPPEPARLAAALAR